MTGPGRVWFSFGGKNKTVVGYIYINSCAIAMFIDGLNIRESRPLNAGSRNTAVINVHHCTHLSLQHVKINGNNTTSAAFQADYTNSSIWDAVLTNVTTGYLINSNMGICESVTGTLTYSVWCCAGIIYCVGTIPTGSRATTKNGVIYTTGITTGGATNPAAVTPEATTTFNTTLTRSYRGNVWRTDTTDIVQGAYNEGGYNAAVGWNYGCFWFGTLKSTLTGRTVRSAILTLTRKADSGPGASVRVYLYGIPNTTNSGTLSLKYFIGYIGSMARGQTLKVNLPIGLVQGIISGIYGGFCLYEGDYNFGRSAYSSAYSRYANPTLYVVYS